MIKKLPVITIVFILLFTMFIPSVKADKTLGDLKNELAALKAKRDGNAAAKSQTQSQINATNASISDAQAQMKQAEVDIEIAKRKIEESNAKIEKTKEESKKLLVFYEIMQNDDMIVDYMSGAKNMTELVMRADAVGQILTYNKNKLAELERLIEENKQLQIDLKQKEEYLEQKIKEYEASVSVLEDNLASLDKLSWDINSQISAQEQLIKHYQAIGCKDNQYLSQCVNVTNNSGWLRPTDKGYISSVFGWRMLTLNGRTYSEYHTGVDIAGVNSSTKIYPTANGTVAAVIWHASCGGNQVVIHTRVNGADYSIHYAHMTEIYVKVGQQVSTQTPVGTVGGGGGTIRANGGWDSCSTGYHLHYNVARGHYLGNGYSSYSKYVANSMSPPGLPRYGSWYYSRY